MTQSRRGIGKFFGDAARVGGHMLLSPGIFGLKAVGAIPVDADPTGGLKVITSSLGMKKKKKQAQPKSQHKLHQGIRGKKYTKSEVKVMNKALDNEKKRERRVHKKGKK